MTTLTYKPDGEEQAFAINLNEGETVLDGLLRHGHDVPHGCRAGICQSCIIASDSDNIPERAQQGLKETHKKLGYFLSCSCVPSAPMSLHPARLDAAKKTAKVLEKTHLSDNIVRLRVEKVFDYRPGQFATIWKDQHIARSYSIASLPANEQFIEFHIKRIPEGCFSSWAYDELTEGHEIQLQGPLGECFYVKSDTEQALFLAGIGTGLAPLYGIVRDALQQGHTGNIDLVIAAKQSESYYLVEPLLQMEERFPQLHIHFISQKITQRWPTNNLIEGDVYDEIKKLVPDFKHRKVFLCGAESFVRKMKKQCFLAGANMRDILSDPFLAFGA